VEPDRSGFAESESRGVRAQGDYRPGARL